MPIAIIIALVLAGGVSVTAQHATPGSILYPVKTQVNEEVKSALAFSTEGKASVHADLAAERLEEMEEVAAAADVKADVIADLKARFDAQAQLFNELVAKLKTDGNDEAAARVSAAFSTVIAAHQATLTRLSAESTTSANVAVRPTIRNVVETLQVLKAHTQADAHATVGADTDEDDGTDAEVNVQTGTSVNAEHATSGIQIQGTTHVGI